ncbi:MAG TPA: DUF2950 domain-containing protein [Thermoanaerobaculia bacterium]|nr:DUF2950 domain-containing protein [Thermoanaerobaculia bacterium]
MKRFRSLMADAALALVLAIGTTARVSATPDGQRFSSPEKAVEAFVASVRQYDLAKLTAIFGKGSEKIFDTGDAAADQNLRTAFLKLYDEKHTITRHPDGAEILVVGKGEWPYPIPIVKAGNEWAFDTPAGFEEIINRRIGRNELDTIQTCLAIVDAQHEYYMSDPDKDAVMAYAQKFRSSPGKKDGLYWPTKPGEKASPLGEFAATAASEGYSDASPYHGYYYRMLYSQGKSAPGGAFDYMAHGKLIGGFAVVAWPASYGDTGIMTFIVNYSGAVYQKDLGPHTAEEVAKIKSFDPGPGWKKESAKDEQPLPAD